jgi:predicted nucleic acid-binding protein
MMIFVDTSALYALLDADDANHPHARQAWQQWLEQPAHFVCSNYVLVETIALIQRHLGIVAVRRFQEELLPIFQIRWIEADLHRAAMSALLTVDRRQLSLVDCTTLELMRRLGLRVIFAFDGHFTEYGFTCLPA